MQKLFTSNQSVILAALLTTITFPVYSAAAEPDVTPSQLITSMEAANGVHAGQRRNHTKGTCAAGDFVGTPEAAVYSKSALFSGAHIPVVARFSLAGGDPDSPDSAGSPRGLAIEYHLPNGNRQHMTMLNTPVFLTSQPAVFNDLLVASKPDPATGKPDMKADPGIFCQPSGYVGVHQFYETTQPACQLFQLSVLQYSYLQIH
jgi:catalase